MNSRLMVAVAVLAFTVGCTAPATEEAPTSIPVNSLKYLREHRPGEFVICEVSRI